MPSVSILAPGTAINRKSSLVTVAAGSVATVGIYTASGMLPSNVLAYVSQATPGADVRHVLLTANLPAVSINAPGDYYVNIDTVGPSGVAVGAFSG